MGGTNVRMADQRDIAHILQPHHTDQISGFIRTPKPDVVGNFLNEIRPLHVWFVPTVCGNDSPIGIGGLVNDRVDHWNVVIATGPDHVTVSLSVSWREE